MLETNVQNLAVTANQSIAFGANSLQTGCTVTHTAGSTVVKLNKPGIYEVAFNAYGITTAAGAFGAQLVVNGIADTTAASSATTSAASDTAAISFTKLIRVAPSCACVNNAKSLTVVYTGSAGTIDNANLIVTKLK